MKYRIIASVLLITTSSAFADTVTTTPNNSNIASNNGAADHVTSTEGSVEANGTFANTGDHRASTPSGTHGATGTPSRSATATGANNR